MTPELKTFHQDAERVSANVPLRAFMRGALGSYEKTRALTQSRYRDYAGARNAAAAIKWEGLENLPAMLESFADKLESRALVSRTRSERDARMQHIRITRVGATLVDRSVQALLEGEQVALAALSAAERAILVELLHKIAMSRKRGDSAE